MSYSELLEAFVLVGQKIDVLWNFYVTVHLAIVGLLLYSDKKVRSKLSLTAISIAYLAFSFINFRAKDAEYNLYRILATELKNISTPSSGFSSFFQSYDFSDRLLINMIVHIGSIILLVVVYMCSYREAKQ